MYKLIVIISLAATIILLQPSNAECLDSKASRLEKELTDINQTHPISDYVVWMAQFEYLKTDQGYREDWLSRAEERITNIKKGLDK